MTKTRVDWEEAPRTFGARVSVRRSPLGFGDLVGFHVFDDGGEELEAWAFTKETAENIANSLLEAIGKLRQEEE